MLNLMGIGYKKEHLSIEMLEILKDADEVYLEYYTSFYGSTFEELEELIDKKITICDREIIESKIEERILIQFTRDITSKNIPNSPHFHSQHTLLSVF